MTIRALMILGPTASGKTAASLEIAKRRDIEIISIDSALIYRGMDIGTAKPDAAERAVCPHHLIDICDIGESYSAAQFRDDALRLMDEIRDRGRFPVICGGTMMYAKMLREGIDDVPKVPDEVRDEIMRRGWEIGWPAMHDELAKIDPVTAARLRVTDSQRIGRAMSVCLHSGRPFSTYLSGDKEPDPSILTVGLVPAERARLHANIGIRYDKMVRDGLFDEVAGLMKRDDFDEESPSMRCVGYRQSIEYLKGECTREESIEKGKAATRQLAKRQMTWLRSMPQVHIIDPYVIGTAELAGKLLDLCDAKGNE